MNPNQTTCLRALMQSVSVASFMLVALCGWAAPIESVSGSMQPALKAPAEDNKAAASALRFWRSLTLSQGTTRHDYREPDPFGRVNPLNSETGSVPTTELTLRWRGALHCEVTPTWLLGLRYEAQRMNTGTSLTEAGMQYPGSSNNEQSLVVSLVHHF